MTTDQDYYPRRKPKEAEAETSCHVGSQTKATKLTFSEVRKVNREASKYNEAYKQFLVCTKFQLPAQLVAECEVYELTQGVASVVLMELARAQQQDGYQVMYLHSSRQQLAQSQGSSKLWLVSWREYKDLKVAIVQPKRI